MQRIENLLIDVDYVDYVQWNNFKNLSSLLWIIGFSGQRTRRANDYNKVGPPEEIKLNSSLNLKQQRKRGWMMQSERLKIN